MNFIQGYFSGESPTSRIRINDDKAWLTIKGRTEGISRPEYEYAIPVDDAREMIDLFCGERVLSKKRHLIKGANHIWEVDEFLGKHEGLVVAEIELSTEGECFERPDWLGKEVSGDPSFYNQVLAHKKRPN